MESYSQLLYDLFIKDERYMFLVNGLIFTLGVTFVAAILGIVLGVLLSLMSISDIKPFRHSNNKYLKNFNPISQLAIIYITVIRGTPTAVQLFILVFIVFVGKLADTPIYVSATLAFGMNSGAYVAEIIRAGIQGLDKGQMEAARALGLNYNQSMKVIILPQAIKKIMPALVSEFIILLKETSIVGLVGGADLTFAAKTIQSITYRATEPLILIALIYLILTTIFTYFMRKIERRLKASD